MSNHMVIVRRAISDFEKAIKAESKATFGPEAIAAQIDLKHKRKALEELVEKLIGDKYGSNTRSESEGIRQETDED